MKTIAAAALLALGACASTNDERSRDWIGGEGRVLAEGYQRDMTRLLGGRSVGDALRALADEGYDCATGEALDRHPDPISVCSKSFATRACQTDWEVTLYPKARIVRRVEAAFTRDCVGVHRDWPSPKRSAIDDGLAEPPR